MITSNKGIELIKKFEGFKKKAYRCPAGVWTIGYGHTDGVKCGDNITEQEAERLLRSDLAAAEAAVLATGCQTHGTRINQQQFDALVSFVFNVGTGNFHKSTLRQMVISYPGNPNIRGEFLKWNKSGGKVLTGLTNRRLAEAKMYFGE